MIKYYSSIPGVKALYYESGKTVGLASGLIIHPDSGKIEALEVQLAGKKRIIPRNRIIEIKKNIYIQEGFQPMLSKDNVRVTEILAEKRFYLGSRVRNEAGVFYGRVKDFTFETEYLVIRSLLTEKSLLGFFPERKIIHTERILRVEKGFIVVEDEEETQRSSVLLSPLDPVGN